MRGGGKMQVLVRGEVIYAGRGVDMEVKVEEATVEHPKKGPILEEEEKEDVNKK